MSRYSHNQELKISAWPEDGLESVEACPVCHGKSKSVLYSGLTDRVFYCAPGDWTLYRCHTCGSAYLDPRPTSRSVGQAYSEYFTHAAPARTDTLPAIPLSKMRYALRNGYLNIRYGYHFEPTLWPGFLLAYLFPLRKAREDRWLRQLKFSRGTPRLLDIGCGNGFFLKRMQAAGWVVQGIDPDPSAVSAAREGNIPVQEGNLSDGEFNDDYFDAVTLAHVIEHFHDPCTALSICFRTLRPGGILWIATPNLNAFGHHLFESDWLGLDPPRHLTLFTNDSLINLIKIAGFEMLSIPTPVPNAEWMFQASLAIVKGAAPFGDLPPLPDDLRRKARIADLWAILHPSSAEELVILARKPR